MDVKTGFLNGFLEEERYWFNTKVSKSQGRNTLLYGLKQASRVSYNTLAAFLENLGIHPTLVSELKSALKKRFSMTDLGEHKYASKILDRFSDYIPYPIATPAVRSVPRSISNRSIDAPEKDAMKSFPYGEAVGSISYLMVDALSDMTFYMREVSEFLADPLMESGTRKQVSKV
ncbi:hypothetical protein PHMEG_00015291 [Phytophthora megakarya]|uniref:Reverse transcriptase Ty1/copia-type domain-containing protein n=1 Tax=Phytophthora megakarya TaxID=4795 RepID=A0A225W281_9STRA|nr:hypothetical protein PHMEG_00015291 [Phytophthora megakarya]